MSFIHRVGKIGYNNFHSRPLHSKSIDAKKYESRAILMSTI
jgi:hypothetical protein